MTVEQDRVSLKRKAAAILLPLFVVAGVVWLTMSLPPETAALWFGKTVEHCPNQEISCPATQPGLLMIPLAVALIYLAYEDRAE